MREIKHHHCGPLNNSLVVTTTDELTAGGANFRYAIGHDVHGTLLEIVFHTGPFENDMPKGITGEALLAILIDRLQSFQAGPFNCRENAIAVTHLQDAMHWLQHRTRDRLERGVEGQALP